MAAASATPKMTAGGCRTARHRRWQDRHAKGPGDLAAIGPGVAHDLEAIEDAAFTVTVALAGGR